MAIKKCKLTKSQQRVCDLYINEDGTNKNPREILIRICTLEFYDEGDVLFMFKTNCGFKYTQRVGRRGGIKE